MAVSGLREIGADRAAVEEATAGARRAAEANHVTRLPAQAVIDLLSGLL